jgi:D-alanyl-D-alanine carboxypeptidase
VNTTVMHRMSSTTRRHRLALAAAFVAAGAAFLPRVAGQTTAPAGIELPATVRTAIDKAATEVLESTGAPSASIAVVREGQIAYVQAYGKARIEPAVPATTEMRYSIGSISKQFTAAAILLLAEEKKLSLDDPVGRWLPDLTRASDVTVRHVLSMTSGYQDFWPQDYVMPGMMLATTPQQILNGWARIPLDFEPGTRWQYSNTNYVIAGLIVERVSGVSLVAFLRRRVFTPLGMTTVADSDEAALGPGDPMRYLRYALGPPRPAPKEGKGWMFAAGELAMTARDLARWDIATIDRTILKPESYQAMQANTLLRNGLGTNYGLGVQVSAAGGRRQVSHTGEVSGFTAANVIYPDDRAAVVVLTNLDATGASSQIASRIGNAIFGSAGGDTGAEQALARARTVFEGLQHGRIDRGLFTANANAYFSEAALTDFAAGLGPLGTPQEFEQANQSLRGGMTARSYRIRFPSRTLRLTTFVMPDGRLEQYQIAVGE